jgi:glycosyltransferase involved in cell wall biosynthesis
VEVKIYDGGSSDASLDVLKNHPAGFSWISEADGGRTEAVNRGFRESTGDVIGILNSDDILTPGALGAVARYFEANRDCLAVYGKAHYIDTRGAIMGRYYTEPWNYARLQEVCYLCQPAVFIRREVVEQFGLLDESLRFAPDYEFWLRVGKKVPFHYLQDSVLAGSRRHRNEKKLGQRVYADREILEVILRHGGTPVAVRKWLQYLAHHEAAELAAPSSPVREERRLFMPLFVAAVLKNAARFDIRLSSEWLKELDGQLEAEESQTPVEIARE